MARLLGWCGRVSAAALVPLALVLASPAAFAANGPAARAQAPRSLLASVAFVDGAAFSPGGRVTSQTVPLGAAALVGDLLVAWVSQFDAAGQVAVSDTADGAWTRVTGEKFSNGGGDIALFFVQPALALSSITVTVSAQTPTFIAGSVTHYRGLGLLGSLDSFAIAEHPANPPAAAVDSGPTASVGAGELVFGGLITGGLPGAVTPGATRGRRFVTRVTDDSNSALAADVLSSASGPQDARFTLQNPSDWYTVAAVFRPGLL